MEPVLLLCIAIAVGSLCIVCLLLCHHKVKHSNEKTKELLLPTDEQWFQRKDVCVARCTHENWIVTFLVMALGFTLVAIIMGTLTAFQ